MLRTTTSSTFDEYPDDVIEEKDYIYNGSEACPIYTDHHAIPRSNEKTIRHDLEKLGLPVNIINNADNIYRRMNIGTKRGKKRKMLLFYCIFSAYNEIKEAVDPNELANICDLERSGISKALSMCSQANIKNNSKLPLVRYTPKNYIPLYFKKLNEKWISFPEGSIEDIYVITDEIMADNDDLSYERPQTRA